MAQVVVVGGLFAKSCPTVVTPWTVAHQAPLSMGFSRQEYWSVLPFPSLAQGVCENESMRRAQLLLVKYRGATWKA